MVLVAVSVRHAAALRVLRRSFAQRLRKNVKAALAADMLVGALIIVPAITAMGLMVSGNRQSARGAAVASLSWPAADGPPLLSEPELDPGQMRT